MKTLTIRGRVFWMKITHGTSSLAEDNAPGVERALARLEASLIQLNGEGGDIVMAPETVVSDGTDVMDVSALSASVLDLEVKEESGDDVLC